MVKAHGYGFKCQFLYPTKTFVVETSYYCNQLCYVKCSTYWHSDLLMAQVNNCGVTLSFCHGLVHLQLRTYVIRLSTCVHSSIKLLANIQNIFWDDNVVIVGYNNILWRHLATYTSCSLHWELKICNRNDQNDCRMRVLDKRQNAWEAIHIYCARALQWVDVLCSLFSQLWMPHLHIYILHGTCYYWHFTYRV